MPIFGPPNIEKMKKRCDVEGLIKALNYQKDPAIRLSAVEALETISDPRMVEPLIIALKDNNAIIRKAATKALGRSGSIRAAGVLISAIRDPGFGAPLWMVVEAIKEIGAPAVSYLADMLKSNDKNIRKAAIDVLEKIGWQPGKDESAAVF